MILSESNMIRKQNEIELRIQNKKEAKSKNKISQFPIITQQKTYTKKMTKGQIEYLRKKLFIKINSFVKNNGTKASHPSLHHEKKNYYKE